jgi:hypothetical protein
MIENAKAIVKASNIMTKLKNKRVVLTRDFNFTETKSSYDTRGPLAPVSFQLPSLIVSVCPTDL